MDHDSRFRERTEVASRRRAHESAMVMSVMRKVWWEADGDITDNTHYMAPSFNKYCVPNKDRAEQHRLDGIVFGGVDTQKRSVFSLHQVEVGSAEWNTIESLLRIPDPPFVADRLRAIQRVQNDALHATWLDYIERTPPRDPEVELRIGYHGASGTHRWADIFSQGFRPNLCRNSRNGVGTYFAGCASESLYKGYEDTYIYDEDPTTRYRFVSLNACYAGRTKHSPSLQDAIPAGYGSYGTEDSEPYCIPTAFCVQDYARVYPAYALTFIDDYDWRRIG